MAIEKLSGQTVHLSRQLGPDEIFKNIFKMPAAMDTGRAQLTGWMATIKRPNKSNQNRPIHSKEDRIITIATTQIYVKVS